MSKVKVFEPQINLVKKDEYYLFYEMLMQSLRTDNVKEGVNKSLYLLRVFLGSNKIVLYRKNVNGLYIYKDSDSPMDESVKDLTMLVNKNKTKIEKKVIFHSDITFADKCEPVALLYMKLEDRDCILAIRGYNDKKTLETNFWEMVRETMQIILKRAVSYERNISAITTDLLTGLGNRNSYEDRVKNLNNKKENLVFAIFDLFRLKYINDNYSHAKGDIYIREAAKILDKYWPSQLIEINDDGTERFIETGHNVYRIGGDEFVLLTTAESIDEVKRKAFQASDEAKRILLGIEDELPVGLNYGIVKHSKGGIIKDTFIKADAVLSEDKKRMYQKYGLDRRR